MKDEKPQGLLTSPRELHQLGEDTSGQLVTEWVLVLAFAVMPMVLLIPTFLGIIQTYFYRIAEVVGSPFP